MYEQDEHVATESYAPGQQSAGPAATLSLLAFHREGVRELPLLPGHDVVIGRDPAADLRLDDTSLSRRHARFFLARGQVWVEDLGSTNGVLINEMRAQGPALVAVGDEVRLGAVRIALYTTRVGGGELRASEAVSHESFLRQLDRELARAAAFGRKVALLMVRALKRSDDELVGRWYGRLFAHLRPFDIVSLYGTGTVEIFLPEIDGPAAEERAVALIASRAPGDPALVCGVALFPDGAATREQIVELSRAAVYRATRAAPVQLVFSRDTRTRLSRAELPARQEQSPIAAESARMRELQRTVGQVAPSTVPVLITGETGCGKEVVAHTIHRLGPRSPRPMRSVNCGALPESLIESTLFGHERGAFTGADARQLGIFEVADGSTLLLDEIGELSPSAQVSLLRVLETKRVQRVGSAQEVAVDVRILAATNRDLLQRCAEGTFREDLYYRLSTVVIEVPPLRERQDEIEPLCAHFIAQSREVNATRVRQIDADALKLLQRYPWPGNIRELRNAIDRACVVAATEMIRPDDLPERVRAAVPWPISGAPGATQSAAPSAPLAPAVTDLRSLPGAAQSATPSHKQLLERFEQALLRDALHGAEGNHRRAAEALELPLRTLFHKLRLFDLRHGESSAIEGLAAELRELIRRSVEGAARGASYRERVEAFERELLGWALARAGGDVRRCAADIDVSERTLRGKLKKLGLD